MYPRVEHLCKDMDEDQIMAYAEIWYEETVERIFEGPAAHKSSGYPWSKLPGGDLNGNLLSLYPTQIKDAFMSRLLSMISFKCQEWSAVEMVSANIADPCRVFIKGELHSAAKAKEKRFRLIFNVSLVDILIEQFLFKPLFNKFIANWAISPSLPGVGFHDAGVEDLTQKIGYLKSPCTSDVRGMDWTLKGIDFDRMLAVWSYNSGVNPGCPLYNAMEWRLRALSLSVNILSDGTVIEQTVRGVMKSGAIPTSQGDSLTRVAWGLEIGVTHTFGLEPLDGETYYTAQIPSPIFAMGDDAIEEYIDDAPLKYKELGVIVTDYGKIDPTNIEFCGHLFGLVPSIHKIKLLRWEKSLAEHFNKRYESVEHKYEAWAGIQTELRNMPEEISIAQGIMSKLDWFSEEEVT